MYANNEKISLRQTYRLFLFDFLGIATLVVPSLLAGWCGTYGILCIAIGGIAGGVYLLYLGWCGRRIGMNLLDYAADKILLCVALGFCHILTAGCVGAILTGLVRQSLIQEESYLLLWSLTLVVAGYAVWGGLENRARVYEVLFWFVILPLFVMLLVSIQEVDFSYFSSDKNLSIDSAYKGSALVFLCFESLFSFMYLPGHVALPPKKRKNEIKEILVHVVLAYIAAVAILGLVYFLLIGAFGENALAQMRFPIVTLMSTIQMTGGFLKRLDAIMLAIWVYTVFALLNLNLYYGGKLMASAFKKPMEKRFYFLAVILVFVIGLAIGYMKSAWMIAAQLLWYVQTPLYLIVPGVIAWRSKKGKHAD